MQVSVKDKWGRKDLHLFYDNLIEYTEVLSPEQLGVLLQRVIEFSIDGTIYESSDFNDSGMYLAYKQTCNLQSNLGEKYAEKVAKLIENGRKGGEAKSNKNKQLVANATVKVKEKVKDKDKEKDKGDSFSWFDSLWNEYPLKRGRDKITAEVLEELEQVGEETLRECIRNYEIDRADNPTRATMNGSTFFLGRYKDYLPEVFAPVKKAPTEKETKNASNRKANREKLTKLQQEHDRYTERLERIDKRKNKDEYFRIKEALTSIDGTISKLSEQLGIPVELSYEKLTADEDIGPIFA